MTELHQDNVTRMGYVLAAQLCAAETREEAVQVLRDIETGYPTAVEQAAVTMATLTMLSTELLAGRFNPIERDQLRSIVAAHNRTFGGGDGSRDD